VPVSIKLLIKLSEQPVFPSDICLCAFFVVVEFNMQINSFIVSTFQHVITARMKGVLELPQTEISSHSGTLG
jgi:hypothetical protein